MESPAEVVDSALCAGMKDPRERAALFRLENSYKDFCISSSYWMEVGGAYNRCVIMGPPQVEPENNGLVSPQQLQQQAAAGHQTSFHRLLVHRLADRFCIRRESRSPNTIRLYKCPETRVPAVLLQDLDAAVYYPSNETSMGTSNGVTNLPTMNGSASPLDPTASNKETTTPTEKQPKKKIMLKKRSPGQNVLLRKSSQQSSDPKGRSSDFGASRSSSSDHLEAKERAYAEARARIFNEEQETMSTSNSQEDTTPSSQTQMIDESTAAAMEKLAIHAPTETTDTANGGGNSNYTTDLSPEDRKAVYRNRAEEAADPDFQRGRIRAPVVMGPIPAVAYNAAFYPSPQQAYGSGSLTASAPEFVPGGVGGGGGNSYLGAVSGSKPFVAWSSTPQQLRTKISSSAPPLRYDAQQQQPRGAWGFSQQGNAPLTTSSPQAARRQSYQKQRPGSFSSPQEKAPTPTMAHHRPLSAPPAANATNPATPVASTVGVFPA